MSHSVRIPAHLYVPGDDGAKIAKSATLSVGSVILDLEDAIAPSRKDAARANLGEAVALAHPNDVWVRINQGPLAKPDLEAVLAIPQVAGIWIPKAEAQPWFFELLEFLEGQRPLGVGALIESASGYIARDAIMAPARVNRVQIGEYDFRADTGMAELSEATFHHLDSVRMDIVLSALAHGLDEIVGSVSADFRHRETYRETTQFLFDTGHTSRACIHPDQVAIVSELGVPTPQELERAAQTVAEFEANSDRGLGAYVDDTGNMVDLATIRQSRRLLRRHRG